MTNTVPIAYTKTDKSGAWAVTVGSAIWGLFWIPLRYLEDAGIPGLWAVALVLTTAFVPSLLATIWRRELSELTTVNGWVVGFALSTSTVLYFTAVLYTDVIRAIFLFYLLPLWTTLSARLLYGEPIRRAQLAVIAAALVGVWLLLGGGFSFPVPNNVGDWCAIAAGFCWGFSLSLLRSKEDTRPFASTTATLFSGIILSSASALILQYWLSVGMHSNPEPVSLIKTIPVAVAFGAALIFPSMLSQIWGARRIPAPTAALLTMTEILVATGSAGLLIGTDLPPISLLGGMIIITAVCIDLAVKRRAPS
ncbi:MAG: drug/metabolite transporter (DMT)-like permease [Granulosicoccus sp.]|jgi:drug/metabolite transporter (DMT)-like permease